MSYETKAPKTTIIIVHHLRKSGPYDAGARALKKVTRG